MAQVVKVLGDLAKKAGLKAPWRVTGPLASSEWLSQDAMASEYREKAPMNSTEEGQPQVPWADNDKIYDIKYFNRDYRHAGAVGGLPVSKTQVVRMEKAVGGPDIPGGDSLDGPVPAVFGKRSHSLNTRSDLAPSGYTGDAETPTA